MTQSNKPVVKYRPSESDRIRVGHPAYVHPVDHTSPLVSNKRFVFTSPVVSKSDDGSFETRNSVYVPVNTTTDRIKPEPKPDIVRYVNCQGIRHNIRIIFDGETKELKSVELVK